jgi:hypothetical protein
VAIRWVFLLTTHMLPPHIKRKRCKKKFYFLPHTTQERKEMQQRKKRERRERRRRKKEDHGAEQPAIETLRWVLPAMGLRDPRYFFSLFGDLRKDLAGRMKPTAGSCRKDLTRDQTPRGRPTGHRDPQLGLANHGFGFFLFFFFLSI